MPTTPESVARHPFADPDLLTLLAQDPDSGIRRLIASHPNTTPDTLDAFLRDSDEMVRTIAARHLARFSAPSTPPQKIPQGNSEDLVTIARTTTDSHRLRTFSTYPDRWVRAAVAANPHTPSSVVERLASVSFDPWFHQCLAHNPQATATVLAISFTQCPRYPFLYDLIATHPQADASLLDRLAQTEDANLRAHVAHHPHLADDTARCLAHDSEVTVRQSLAANHQATSPILEILSVDPTPSVRTAVVNNPNTPFQILARLALEFPEQVAQHAHADPDTLRHLSRHSWDPVRELVALNPHTPGDALADLAHDPGLWCQMGVALNPATPTAVLEALGTASKTELIVLTRLAERPDIPEHCLRAWAVQTTQANDWILRSCVAKNRSTPPDVLAFLRSDPDWMVRQAATR